jgi:GntR family transcriptional regulator/MocR family aminotransferase
MSQEGPVGDRELLVELDRDSEVPLHAQLERRLREDVRAGRLAAGARLPSSRGLAAALGISRGVVSEAYGQLAAEGYLSSRQGAPVTVAGAVRSAAPAIAARSLVEPRAYDVTPGRPDLAGFPRDAWLRSMRAAWRQAPIEAIGYPDPRGLPALREALAGYLGRARGTAVDPEHMLVTTGFTQALALVCRWLAAQGIERVGVEEPGWHRHRLTVESAGLEVVPVPVDGDGIHVGALAATGVAAVVTTPAHQFPTGVVLSPERRAALIEWAEEDDRLIVEDDYDAELRYDRTRRGALQGLAAERVVFIGSASKRLAPGLRLGWMLAPSWLAWPLATAKAVEDSGGEVVSQLALVDFIERGELDRHLRRMRMRYADRREALLAAVDEHIPGAAAGVGNAGLFELVALAPGTDEARVIEAAAARGVGVEGLGLHSYTGDTEPALVLGYAGLAEPALDRAVRLLAEAILDLPSAG